jgi:enediyne biosynthesis protein E4
LTGAVTERSRRVGAQRAAAPLLLGTVGVCLLAGCSAASDPTPPPAAGRLFTRLPASYSGVRFENRLTDTPELNVFTYRNYYNGGGVALGDLTGDGLPEVVLTSNLEGTRVYLNQGKFRFRDVTDRAGLRSKGWATGVTLADVNGDGRLDIYVCHAGLGDSRLRANELYLNQGLNADGLPTFVEQAAAYGVADSGYSTHAAFFDYDRDGDLDLFVINNSPQPVASLPLRNTRDVRDPLGGARLYRNDGGHFVDVSAAAGIFGGEIGLGLGLVVSDVNRDGWPDMYVANDFFERDYLYINQRDGTFAERLEHEMPYISLSSMGLDIADVNNDGWPDIYVADMLPDDEHRLKTTSSFESWDRLQTELGNDFHYQFTRNMLHLNNGNGTFSDIGQMAGVARTDWSWSVLLADLDLDGYKDIYVTNGLAKDVTSQDYIAFLANRETMVQATSGGGGRVDFRRLIDAMSSTKLPNYAFHNRGDLTFSNESAAWGLDTPSFSSGAAYGDLDGDGALDLVVNNVNQEAFVYRNNARSLTRNRYLQVRLDGSGANRFGVGANVTLWSSGRGFYQEMEPTRGFQSSVDYVLTFGVGQRDTLDSVKVEWPGREGEGRGGGRGGGRVSLLTRVATNQRLTVRESEAVPAPAPSPQPLAPLFTNVTDAIGLPYAHRENEFVDFDREPLIPKLLSTEGPMLAVADVNGDGLDDMFIGGAKGQAGKLLIQPADGRFVSTNERLFERDRVSEDLGAVFFDADGDGHADLYVVSGGSEFSSSRDPALQDRLYLNDGHGRLRKATGSLPPEDVSGSRAVAADYDGDADADLFVGGRVVPWHYGVDPRSMLLQNDGHGRFTDVTKRLAPELERVGMVTDAVWRDADGDGRADLVVVGEWMPITIFHNAGGGRLVRLKTPGLEHSEGWWNRIVAGAFTGKGRVDFIVGNLGLNTRLSASDVEPVTMYAKDFDENGVTDQIVSVYNHGTSHPIAMRDELLTALPYLKPRYPRYADYAGQTVADIFSPAQLAGATVKQAHTFATALARNNGDGSFTLVPLPLEAQLAPVYGILAQDVDGDGKPDLLLAGNFDGVQPAIGRMSASYGLLLRGDGTGRFTPLRTAQSGFLVPGQARDIQRVRMRRGDLYVVTRNNDRPLVLAALGLDDDHPVGTAHAVDRGLGGVLQHLDRRDVVRIDAFEATARAGLHRHVVDHIQGLVAPLERADPADANGDTAVGGPRHHHAGKAVHQQLLDRSAGHALDFFRRHY